MAHIVPGNVAGLVLAGGHQAELDTVALLQKKLGDAYTVFHGVHWTPPPREASSSASSTSS